MKRDERTISCNTINGDVIEVDINGETCKTQCNLLIHPDVSLIITDVILEAGFISFWCEILTYESRVRHMLNIDTRMAKIRRRKDNILHCCE